MAPGNASAPDPEPSVGGLRPLHEADAGDRDAATLSAARALSRTRDALQRDEAARRRDLNAIARDRAAEARDRAASRRELSAQDEAEDRRLRRAVAGLRALAAEDRARAAADREQAAADRAHAAADRRQARIDLARAQLDHLTGVFTRGLGETALQHEIDRAERSGEPFTLAFVDVDGLKALNDGEGHHAGDCFLQSLAETMRANLRSYDPIVRVGGDEFICGFVGAARPAAERRIAKIRRALTQVPTSTTISVGLAQLEPGEGLHDLVARADAEVYRDKERAHS